MHKLAAAGCIVPLRPRVQRLLSADRHESSQLSCRGSWVSAAAVKKSRFPNLWFQIPGCDLQQVLDLFVFSVSISFASSRSASTPHSTPVHQHDRRIAALGLSRFVKTAKIFVLHHTQTPNAPYALSDMTMTAMQTSNINLQTPHQLRCMSLSARVQGRVTVVVSTR